MPLITHHLSLPEDATVPDPRHIPVSCGADLNTIAGTVSVSGSTSWVNCPECLTVLSDVGHTDPAKDPS